jgi:transposase-like protein
MSPTDPQQSDHRRRRPVRTTEERLTILETWVRSKLPAPAFSAIVDVSPQQLYCWKRLFDAKMPSGPAGI